MARPPSLLALATASYAAEVQEAPRLDTIEPAHGEPPLVESPPLAVDWDAAERRVLIPANDAGSGALIEAEAIERGVAPSSRRAAMRKSPLRLLPTTAAAMCGLIAALFIWRGEMVRLMPQTAGFYRLIGLDVNQRGLAFRDVKLSTETVDGKPVLVIEGSIESRRRVPVNIPALHFAVRNTQGTTIYGWNAKTDQVALKPGESAAFRSRLASPPAEANSIDVRFLHKRDLATGAA